MIKIGKKYFNDKGFKSVGFKTAMIFGYSKLLSKKKCIFEGESIRARTQTLQLQILYTLSFHLMKVLSLLSFTERLHKASKIGLFFEKLEKLEKNYKIA